MCYDASYPELGGYRQEATPHSSLSLHVGECPQCLEHLKHLEDSTLVPPQPSAKSKTPLNGRHTFLDGIRVGKRLQLAEDRIIVEEIRGQLRFWTEKMSKILARATTFRTELDNIFAMTNLGEDDYDEDAFVSEENLGCNHEINKEKGDGEDGKCVVKSEGWSDEEGECSALEETEEEFSSDEQAHETDISSGSEEGYEVENNADIRANMIHFDTDTDDDQPDTSDGETDVQVSPNRFGEITLQCGFMYFDNDEEDDFNPGLTIEGLAKLITEAHEPGNFHQLFSVRHHIRKAQRTSKDRRTLAQSYLLHHWRRSPASLASHPPTPELFVDASQFGIGLYLGTRWLAWTFRHGHSDIKYGPDGKINASWAELIAVEIGIHVVLAEGYPYAHISIWSDNMGVVEALERGSWTTNHGLDAILSRIMDLRKHFWSLSPKWIPSKMNPADNASRGAYPPKKMMLSYSPILPRHLMRFMAKVDLD